MSSTLNGRSECEIHIRASIPSLAPSPSCAFIRPMVASYAPLKPNPSVIVRSFSRLRWSVVSCKIASIFRDTSRNLDTDLSAHDFTYFVSAHAPYLHFRNRLGNVLYNLLLQGLVHRVRCCIFFQFRPQESNDITFGRCNRYPRYIPG